MVDPSSMPSQGCHSGDFVCPEDRTTARPFSPHQGKSHKDAVTPDTPEPGRRALHASVFATPHDRSAAHSTHPASGERPATSEQRGPWTVTREPSVSRSRLAQATRQPTRCRAASVRSGPGSSSRGRGLPLPSSNAPQTRFPRCDLCPVCLGRGLGGGLRRRPVDSLLVLVPYFPRARARTTEHISRSK